jgi:hypothetical protein
MADQDYDVGDRLAQMEAAATAHAARTQEARLMRGNTPPPSFPALDANVARRQALRDEAEQHRRTQAQLHFDAQALDRRMAASVSVVEIEQLSRERERKRQRALDLVTRIHRCEQDAGDLASEATQMADDYEGLLSARVRLSRELGNRRGESRATILTRLATVLRRLAHYEGNEALTAEVQRLEAEAADASPWWTCDQCYCWQNGRLIPESRMTGVGTVAFGKGVRIEKTEARRLGLLKGKPNGR